MSAFVPLAERLWRNVEPTGFCWLWTGAVDEKGYGKISDGRKGKRVHRVAYELLVGPIPEGLCLDHLCRVRRCVNPDHLEPVSSRVNTLRGFGLAGVNARRTCCAQGHPHLGNVYRWHGKRYCRACRRARMARIRAAQLSEAAS